MAEWSKAAVLKTVIPRDRDRGFESHSLLCLMRFVRNIKRVGFLQALIRREIEDEWNRISCLQGQIQVQENRYLYYYQLLGLQLLELQS